MYKPLNLGGPTPDAVNVPAKDVTVATPAPASTDFGKGASSTAPATQTPYDVYSDPADIAPTK